MKKVLITLAVLQACFAINAQTQPTFVNNPYPKTITVSGSAEMELIPDEIYVQVTLREYQKKGDPKKDIETLKTNFLDACKSVGVADTAISIVSFSGYNNYYAMRRGKIPDMNANITYQVKFKTSKLMDDLVLKLDDEATQSFNITGTNHSRITEFRKQLKIKAVQAAKDKGIYLTEAIGEKLGEAITIIEPSEPGFYAGSNVMSQARLNYNARYEEVALNEDKRGSVDFRKMKLRFEVNIVFALK